jgi:hypothetical protein
MELLGLRADPRSALIPPIPAFRCAMSVAECTMNHNTSGPDR